MATYWEDIVRIATDEVDALIRALPLDLQPLALTLPILYLDYPDDALLSEGLDPDLLGLYTGDPVGISGEEAGSSPREIRLFLQNIWDYADAEEAIYREEVRVTFLHEFGHFLGLDEDQLEERGLI
ncbi:MAG: metallopeptidase family protein [Pedosphaera sp.]|nr:metallopeptidase family protein [Pedosphaera sp.]